MQVAPSQFSVYLAGCRFAHEEVLLKVDSESEASAVRDSWHVKNGTCHSESCLASTWKSGSAAERLASLSHFVFFEL
jgi:hypothetical protein